MATNSKTTIKPATKTSAAKPATKPAAKTKPAPKTKPVIKTDPEIDRIKLAATEKLAQTPINEDFVPDYNTIPMPDYNVNPIFDNPGQETSKTETKKRPTPRHGVRRNFGQKIRQTKENKEQKEKKLDHAEVIMNALAGWIEEEKSRLIYRATQSDRCKNSIAKFLSLVQENKMFLLGICIFTIFFCLPVLFGSTDPTPQTSVTQTQPTVSIPTAPQKETMPQQYTIKGVYGQTPFIIHIRPNQTGQKAPAEQNVQNIDREKLLRYLEQE